MTTTLESKRRLDRIALLVARLAARQQQELERQLELLLLREEARALENSVEENNITMKEIVEEVKKVRHGQ